MTKTDKSEQPYWKNVPLAEMSKAQWEALCDHCGKCCLVKLEDEETGDIAFTDIICDMYDEAACGCANYARRTELVPSCVQLTPKNLGQLTFMPPSCAYRLLYEGRDLPDWHPLVSGDAVTVVEAG
ncbi:MAG: YcgN family cysteine cluster protein, partial [Rhodobiaceae bacterium]